MIFFAKMYYIPLLIVYIANILIVRLGIFSKKHHKTLVSKN